LSEHDPVFDSAAGDHAPADAVDHSLTDDVRALIDDGKTYLEAELQFQKSRAAFIADRSRSGAIYAVSALLLVHLALVALAIGLIFALTPLITAWGATAVVVGLLLVGSIVLGLAAKKRFAGLSSAFGGESK
jgi:Flp pilus assembly protein TadB